VTLSLQAALAILASAAAVLAWFGARFFDAQSRGALGGRISRAKAYWLPFAVFFWFVVCPVAAALDVLARPLSLALFWFSAFMWLRGAAEMVMLYVTKSWRPPYGISHDALCIVLIVSVLGWQHEALSSLSAFDAWGVALVALLLVSLGVEIHHAWSFFVAVGGRTMGEAGVWFADDVDERFRKINRNTFRWNVMLSAGLAVILARLLAQAGGRA
jgi:hypothetical protein